MADYTQKANDFFAGLGKPVPVTDGSTGNTAVNEFFSGLKSTPQPTVTPTPTPTPSPNIFQNAQAYLTSLFKPQPTTIPLAKQLTTISQVNPGASTTEPPQSIVQKAVEKIAPGIPPLWAALQVAKIPKAVEDWNALPEGEKTVKFYTAVEDASVPFLKTAYPTRLELGLVEKKYGQKTSSIEDIAKRNPAAYFLGVTAGDIYNIMLMSELTAGLGVGTGTIAPPWLKTASPFLSRVINAMPSRVTTFGLKGLLDEAFNQGEKGVVEPGKLAKAELGGMGFGAVISPYTQIISTPARVAASAATMEAIGIASTLIQKKMITAEDWLNITANAAMVAVFEMVGAKGVSARLAEETRYNYGHEVNVQRIISRYEYMRSVAPDTTPIDPNIRATAEQAITLGEKVHSIYLSKKYGLAKPVDYRPVAGEKPPVEVVRQIDESMLPVYQDVAKLDTKAQYKLADSIASDILTQVKNGIPIYEAVNTAMKENVAKAVTGQELPVTPPAPVVQPAPVTVPVTAPAVQPVEQPVLQTPAPTVTPVSAVTVAQNFKNKGTLQEKLVNNIQQKIESGDAIYVDQLRAQVKGKPAVMKALEEAVTEAKRRIAAPKEVPQKKTLATGKEEVITPTIKVAGVEKASATIHPDSEGIYASLNVVLTPEFQRKGIGTKIVADLENQLAQKGITTVEIDALPESIGFWKKMGYKALAHYGADEMTPMGKTLELPKGVKEVTVTVAQPKAKPAKKSLAEISKKTIKPHTTNKREYTKHNTALYQSKYDWETGEKLLSNEEAEKIIRQYFTAQEVPIVFVDAMKTPDGGKGWSKYSKQVVTFINNPQETAPTHEALHAFLDLFVTPANKDAYLARMMGKLKKTMKREELNLEIRRTQEENSSPARKIPLFLASRIYVEEAMADEFVEFVKTHDAEQEMKTPLRRWFESIFQFIRSWTGKKNIEDLYMDIINRRRDLTNPLFKDQENYFLRQEEKFNTTTKTLNRMRKELVREEVGRDTILSYMRREGTTKLDQELIQDALNEMPTGNVNVADLIAKVQAKIMPLALIRSDTYNDYGTANLGYTLYPGEDASKTSYPFSKEQIHETHIWDSAYRHGITGHFGSDYGEKKLEYDIREVTHPITGVQTFIIYEKGVMLNQDNVNEAVVNITESRKSAEKWIKDHMIELTKKVSGLFGHSRVSTTMSREAVLKNAGLKLKGAEEELKHRQEIVSVRKELYRTINRNKRQFVENFKKEIERLTAELAKKGVDVSKMNWDVSDLIDRNNSEYNTTVDRDVSYPLFIKHIMKDFITPVLRDNINSNSAMEGLVRDFSSGDMERLTQVRLMRLVKRRTELEDAMNYLNEAKESIKKYQGLLYEAQQKTNYPLPVRYLLEVQSDTFQRGNITEVQRLQERMKDILKEENATKPEDLGEYAQGKYKELQQKLTEEEKVPKQRLEGQFMALGGRYHEIALKKELQLAAQDLITDEIKEVKFRAPTPLTMAFIEGYVSPRSLAVRDGSIVKREGEGDKVMFADQEQAEMPPHPVSPIGEGHEDQTAILVNQKISDGLPKYGGYINVDGTLYEVDQTTEDGTIKYLHEMNEDYHLNSFDDMTEAEDLSLGDETNYLGNKVTVLESNSDTWVVAPSDRVREYNVEELVDEAVDSRMEDVYYELRELEKVWGKIDSAAKAQKILDMDGEKAPKALIPGLERKTVSIDAYETRKVLEDMAAADEDKTDLDWNDFTDGAMEAARESEAEYVGSEEYFDGMGSKAYFNDSGDTAWVVEEGGETETIESPESEYNVFPDMELDTNEFEEQTEAALKASGKDTKTYEKEMEAWNKKVAEVKAKYEKMRKDFATHPRANVNELGEYNYTLETAFGADVRKEYQTVFNYYAQRVLPFFRKIRKDAKLITDANGFQWWETRVTPEDVGAIELFKRKDPYETLLEIANEISRKQMVASATKRTAKKPVRVTGKVNLSTAYSRIADEIREEDKRNVYYNQMTIDEDVERAVAFAKQYPEKAINVGFGLEYPPAGVTETAIAKVAAYNAKERGDFDLWSQLIASRSLRQTRRGQEIVAEKGQVTDNSAEYFIKQVLKAREAKVMNQMGWIYKMPFGKKKGTSYPDVIKEKVEKIQKTVENTARSNIQTAQQILDMITCK